MRMNIYRESVCKQSNNHSFHSDSFASFDSCEHVLIAVMLSRHGHSMEVRRNIGRDAEKERKKMIKFRKWSCRTNWSIVVIFACIIRVYDVIYGLRMHVCMVIIIIRFSTRFNPSKYIYFSLFDVLPLWGLCATDADDFHRRKSSFSHDCCFHYNLYE